MTTIQIAEDITATVTFHTANLYRKAEAAEQNYRTALENENFDWQDIAEIDEERWEAWERFFNR